MIDVLIVDDQPLTRMGNSLVLASTDDITVVGEAGTGEEAWDMLAELFPDVILMDVRMPGMGGIEATKKIKSFHPAAKVIVLTSIDLDEYAFGALDAGASAFLLKSASPEQLIHAVRTVHEGNAVVEPRITRKLIERYARASVAGGHPFTNPDTAHELNVLSPRERDVFLAMATGMTNSEISAQLHLSPATVKSHINRIFSKLGLRDRVQAVILAGRLGITGNS